MSSWKLVCPNCGTNNLVASKDIKVDCGKVSCECTCRNCGNQFTGQQEYWEFLELSEDPLESQDQTTK